MLILNLLKEQFLSETTRWIIWLPVGIGIGIATYFSLSFEPNLVLISFVLLIPLLLIFFGLRPFGIILITIVIGFCSSKMRTILIDTKVLNEKIGPVTIHATVSNSEELLKGCRFSVNEIKIIEGNKFYENKLSSVRLTWKNEKPIVARLFPGTRISVRALLEPFKPPVSANSYNFKRQAYFQNLSAQGFVLARPLVLEESSNWFIVLAQIRHWINVRIYEALPKNLAAITCALITGAKAGITQDIRQDFAQSGLSHILAISGLHVGLVGGFIFLFIRMFLCCIPALLLKFNVKKFAACVSWFGTLIYLGISGCGVPSIRAFLMNSIIVLAVLLDRSAFSMRSVSFAATFILLTTPEALLSPSFQMSFAAVIALIAGYESGGFFNNSGRNIIKRTIYNLLGTSYTTLLASSATIPFTVLSFNQMTLNSIPANAISIPLTGIWIMPWAVISLITLPLNLEKIPLKLMGYGIELLCYIAHKVGSWPGSQFILPTPSNLCFSILVLSGLWLSIWINKWRWFGVIGFFIAIIIYLIEPRHDIFINANAKVFGGVIKHKLYVNQIRNAARSWAKETGTSLEKIKNTDTIFNIKKKRVLITISGNVYGNPDFIVYLGNDAKTFQIPFLIAKEIQNQQGASLFINSSNVFIKTVKESVGNRPWK